MNALAKIEQPEELPIYGGRNRNKVVSRNVKRYFVHGKGFARELDAYRELARSELGVKVWRLTDAKERPARTVWLKLPWTTQLQVIADLEKQVMIELFPPKCGKSNTTNLPNLKHGAHTDCCRGCRWDYLNIRAKELKEKETR
jgi:hypothetical protein